MTKRVPISDRYARLLGVIFCPDQWETPRLRPDGQVAALQIKRQWNLHERIKDATQRLYAERTGGATTLTVSSDLGFLLTAVANWEYGPIYAEGGGIWQELATIQTLDKRELVVEVDPSLPPATAVLTRCRRPSG